MLLFGNSSPELLPGSGLEKNAKQQDDVCKELAIAKDEFAYKTTRYKRTQS